MLKQKQKRLCSIELLRIIFILAIAVHHMLNMCPGLHEFLKTLFHTKAMHLNYGIDPFFIIGGFFLHRTLIRNKIRPLDHVKKLWIRLFPAMAFAFIILVFVGNKPWWRFVDFLFFLPGTGIVPAVIRNSEWFICVYFWISCLMIGLFNFSKNGAWIIAGLLAYLATSLVLHGVPVRYTENVDKIYYSVVSIGTCLGLRCICLGMLASWISENLVFSMKHMFRLVATSFEVIAFYMLFSYMFRGSHVKYTPLEVDLVFSLLMLSLASGQGYISAVLNRMTWIQFFSRYTYSFLMGCAIMMQCVHKLRIMLNYDNKGIIVIGGGILLGIIEYHLIEKFLVPKIGNYLIQKNLRETISSQP